MCCMCLLLVKQIHSPTRVRVYVQTLWAGLYVHNIVHIASLIVLIVNIIFVKFYEIIKGRYALSKVYGINSIITRLFWCTIFCIIIKKFF